MNILVENYRSIAKADIAVEGITVIAGENGSGKTSILERAFAEMAKTKWNVSWLCNDGNNSQIKDMVRSILAGENTVSDLMYYPTTFQIIDHPETYLHPTWAVELANIIVLIRKKTGARFLITTHCPAFTSAICYIAKKQKVDGVNFYIAEKTKKGDLYNFRHSKRNLEPLFQSFNKAFDLQDKYSTKGGD